MKHDLLISNLGFKATQSSRVDGSDAPGLGGSGVLESGADLADSSENQASFGVAESFYHDLLLETARREFYCSVPTLVRTLLVVILFLVGMTVTEAGVPKGVPKGVVDLIVPVVDDQGNLAIRQGRGVLIGPRTVMTAAHVVGDLAMPGAGKPVEKVLWNRVRVQHLKTGGLAGARSSRVYLHDSVPRIGAKGRVIDQTGLDLYLVGMMRFYDVAVIGLSEDLCDKSDLPRVSRQYPGVFEKVGVVVGTDKHHVAESLVTGVDHYSVRTKAAMDGGMSDKLTSPGDSGGPLFAPAKNRNSIVVYGIASALTAAESGAWKSSIYARVDGLYDWIQAAKRCAENHSDQRCTPRLRVSSY